jgi:hypothetical protein
MMMTGSDDAALASRTGLARFLATPVALFVPSKSPDTDIAKLALLGLAVTGFFLFTAPVFFPGGAGTFMTYAEAIIYGKTLSPHVAQRDVGFPLIVLLSGYTLNGSLIGIILIHAIFAIAMPILIYLAVYRISATIAFLVGLFAIASLAPIYFMKWIHHDQGYIFFSVLLVAWLTIYLQSCRYPYLYLFTGAALAASFTRPAGNALFPLFLVIAYIAARGRIVHYAACVAIFVVVTFGYMWHRYEIFDMAHSESTPSYTGQQVFYNLYANSAEFDVLLSSALGPNLARITQSLYKAIQPSMRESDFIRRAAVHHYASPTPRKFLEEHIYPFTPGEFIQQVFKFPSWDYWLLMCEAERNDQVFLQASFEIARAHPWYVVSFFGRNVAIFLLRPGAAHTRYNLNPFDRVGLDFPPAFSGSGVEGTSELYSRAAREVQFKPLSVEPMIFAKAFARVEKIWGEWYQPIVTVTLVLMIVAWIGAAVRLICWWRPSLGMCAIGNWFDANGLVASIVAVSVLLFYNVAVTSAFADPDYRYHNFIVLLRILIAGYGLFILARVACSPQLGLARGLQYFLPYRLLVQGIEAIRSHDGLELAFSDRGPSAAVVVGFLTLAVFACWASFMVLHA